MEFKPSKHQKDIFNFIKKGTENGIISAVAGSGKTTTLLKALEVIPKDKTVLFMAFNKSIADELKDRTPKSPNINVKTVHGFGYSTLSKYFTPSIDNRKYTKMFRDIIESYSKKNKAVLQKYGFNKEAIELVSKMGSCGKVNLGERKDYFTNVTSLCNLGRLNLINLESWVDGTNDLHDIAKTYSIGTQDGEVSMAWYLIKLGIHYVDEIDYTDMIFLPTTLSDVSTEQYDFVFIDECQDLNTCQRILMRHAIKPDGGRFIAVGDPKQAIYGFAGADFNSFKKLCQIPNTVQLPLSVTYRCAKNIVTMVKHINKDISPIKKAKEGEIKHSFSYKDLEDGDMVLCRQTLPVVSLCIKLLTEGKRAKIIGSDIGMSLCKMISNCEVASEEFNMINVFSRLYDEKNKLIDKLVKNQNITYEEALEDMFIVQYAEKIQVIEALGGNLTNPTEVIDKIKNIFADKKTTGITLSTIHKSKGLEADRVFIVHPELMPSKYANTDSQKEQENNLIYVAYTRAKTTLGFIDDFDAYDKHKSQVENVKPVVNSKHVGILNTKMSLVLTVVNIKTMNGPHGEFLVVEMVDRNNNFFGRFGTIPEKYIVGPDKTLQIGSVVSFVGMITGHTEFKGLKTTRIGRLS